MNICIAGAGYVGLTTAAVLAELGHTVRCVDLDQRKIDALNEGTVPIYEPGLEELVARHRLGGRLSFGTDVTAGIAGHELVMIAVGTPPAEDGSADLSHVRNVLLDICSGIGGRKTIVIKSTVPPGTGDWAESFMRENGVPADRFDVVSNPEFLREGTALHDSFHPDRIVIGASDAEAAGRVRDLYNGIEAPVLITGRTDAELIKYGSNAFLAVKLSYVNELARACDAFGADIVKVAEGVGMDGRIGGKFLQAGIGYGGSCLPKDVSALIGAASVRGVEMELLRSAERVNATQPDVYVAKLEQSIGPLTPVSVVAVWGASFKENTDDIRESQAIALIGRLKRTGCAVQAFDPLVSPPIEGVAWRRSALEAAEGADALVLSTGWRQFAESDWKEVKARMRGITILDGRNVLDRSKVEQAGLRYVGVGRP